MREQGGKRKSAEIQGIEKERPVRQRRSWSQGEKRRLVEQWNQSGLSRLAFCRQLGLCYSGFLRWEREVAVGGSDGFVEVKIGATQQPSSAFDLAELIAPNGWRIRLSFGYDRREIAALMEMMQQC